MSQSPRTYLAYQRDAKLHKLQTTVLAVHPYAQLKTTNNTRFKAPTDGDHVVITKETIFHPQGGGQPSDEGSMTSAAPDGISFKVREVRHDEVNEGQVLHLGSFETGSEKVFESGWTVEQAIDTEKRVYYSRLHTAGHVLGAAVRHLLEKEVPNFDELKASHFPESAACEFQGLIEGKWLAPVQAKVDEYIAAAMPVRIDFWDEGDFRSRGLERLIPDRSLAPEGEKFRVVEIVGAEVYPCGGTHVDTTDLCGETKVKKISRSKGNSRVSYQVKP